MVRAHHLLYMAVASSAVLFGTACTDGFQSSGSDTTPTTTAPSTTSTTTSTAQPVVTSTTVIDELEHPVGYVEGQVAIAEWRVRGAPDAEYRHQAVDALNLTCHHYDVLADESQPIIEEHREEQLLVREHRDAVDEWLWAYCGRPCDSPSRGQSPSIICDPSTFIDPITGVPYCVIGPNDVVNRVSPSGDSWTPPGTLTIMFLVSNTTDERCFIGSTFSLRVTDPTGEVIEEQGYSVSCKQLVGCVIIAPRGSMDLYFDWTPEGPAGEYTLTLGLQQPRRTPTKFSDDWAARVEVTR